MTIKDEADRLRALAAVVPCEHVSDLARPLNDVRSAVYYILPDPEILGLLESVDAAIAAAAGQLVHLRTTIERVAASHEGLRDPPDGTRPAEGATAKERKPLPPHIKQRMDDGNQFNKDNQDRYPANEVILNNKKVLDSYDPEREIVSRKHTQISEIQPTTWQGYLNEHVTKYQPGQIVKDSPSMREKYPDLVGEELSGQQYMEVPVQNNDVPEWAIRAADKLDVIIRDVTGHVYK